MGRQRDGTLRQNDLCRKTSEKRVGNYNQEFLEDRAANKEHHILTLPTTAHRAIHSDKFNLLTAQFSSGQAAEHQTPVARDTNTKACPRLA
jgi:hypothetical protein